MVQKTCDLAKSLSRTNYSMEKTLKGGGVFNEKREYKGMLGKTWDKIGSDLIFRNLSTSPKWSYI